MDWTNVDLNDDYERSRNLLENYTFDQLILEATCNIKNVSKETIRKQAIESIKAKFDEAIEILDSNLDNITNHVIDYNNIP